MGRLDQGESGHDGESRRRMFQCIDIPLRLSVSMRLGEICDIGHIRGRLENRTVPNGCSTDSRLPRM